MTLSGNVHVPTIDGDLSFSETALQAAGCQVMRADKRTETSRDGPPELYVLMQVLRSSDTLLVTRIDRLARSLKNLQDILHELKGRGVALRAT